MSATGSSMNFTRHRNRNASRASRTGASGLEGRFQMRTRLLASLMAMAAVGAVLYLTPVVMAGQTPQATMKAAATWVPPRTPDGQPDIRGYWGQRNNITTYSLQEGVADRAEHIRMSGQAPALGHPIKDPADEKFLTSLGRQRRPPCTTRCTVLHQNPSCSTRSRAVFWRACRASTFRADFRLLSTSGLW